MMLTVLLLLNTFKIYINWPTAGKFFFPFSICTEKMFSLCSLLIFANFFLFLPTLSPLYAKVMFFPPLQMKFSL